MREIQIILILSKSAGNCKLTDKQKKYGKFKLFLFCQKVREMANRQINKKKVREIHIILILSKSAGNCKLTNKQKSKKVREIQNYSNFVC